VQFGNFSLKKPASGTEDLGLESGQDISLLGNAAVEN
jgi:hypothetical protein